MYPLQSVQSNENSVAGIIGSEIFWRTTFLTFKNAIKIGNIVKAAFIGYFSYRVGGVYQHSRNMPQSNFG